ncbi:hypothetical protein AAMO2058_001758300, partial [Amorphochlora amoebiformis]
MENTIIVLGRYPSELEGWRSIVFAWADYEKIQTKKQMDKKVLQRRQLLDNKMGFQRKSNRRSENRDRVQDGKFDFKRFILRQGQVFNVESARLMAAKPLHFHREVYAVVSEDNTHAEPGLVRRTKMTTIMHQTATEEACARWKEILAKPGKQRNNDDMDFVLAYLETIEYFKKLPEFSRRAPSTALYIMSQGSMELRVTRLSGFWYIACVLFPGEVFGETAFSAPEARRFATAVAKDECEVLEIPVVNYTNWLLRERKLGAVGGETALGEDAAVGPPDMPLERFSNISPVFAHAVLSDERLSRLEKVAVERRFARQTILAKADTKPRGVYVVTKGFCEVIKLVEKPKSKERILVVIGQLKPGDVFGFIPEHSGSHRIGTHETHGTHGTQGITPLSGDDGGSGGSSIGGHKDGSIPYSVISMTEVHAVEFSVSELIRILGEPMNSSDDLAAGEMLEALSDAVKRVDMSTREIKARMKAQAEWKLFTKRSLTEQTAYVEDACLARSMRNGSQHLRASAHCANAEARWLLNAAGGNAAERAPIPKSKGAGSVAHFLLRMAVINGETPQRATVKLEIPDDERYVAGTEVEFESSNTGAPFRLVIPPGYGPGSQLEVVDPTWEDGSDIVTSWFLCQDKNLPNSRPDFNAYFSRTFKCKDKKISNGREDTAKDENDGYPSVDREALSEEEGERLRGLQMDWKRMEKGESRQEALSILLRMYSIHFHAKQFTKAQDCLQKARSEVRAAVGANS